MPNYNGDGTNGGISTASTPISGTVNGTDWLSNILKPISNAVVTVAQTQAQVDALKSQTATQQNYQNTQNAIGSKNIIGGVDNNILLLGLVGVVGIYMFMKG
ncbi:MAG: hypothetical protein R3331_02080 [Sulfurospirillaceae bacterium]|nr:hypothetical protein [Sulfurospirillaceae bacterium]